MGTTIDHYIFIKLNSKRFRVSTLAFRVYVKYAFRFVSATTSVGPVIGGFDPAFRVLVVEQLRRTRRISPTLRSSLVEQKFCAM